MKSIILLFLFFAFLWRPDQAQANFYQGKTVTLISGTSAGPMWLRREVPPDQVKTLREAFAKTMSDREFLAEAKTRNLEIKPTASDPLERLAKDIIVQPPEVIERMKKLLGK